MIQETRPAAPDTTAKGSKDVELVRSVELVRRRSRVPWIYSVYHARSRVPGGGKRGGSRAWQHGRRAPVVETPEDTLFSLL